MQPLMIRKHTIIIIGCFLFMSTASPRLAVCFRVPQLLLQLWEGLEGTGQGQPVGSIYGSHQQGRQVSPDPSFSGSLCAQRHGGPGHTGEVGQRGNSSGQKVVQFSWCPEERGRRESHSSTASTGAWESQGIQAALLQGLSHLAKGWETEQSGWSPHWSVCHLQGTGSLRVAFPRVTILRLWTSPGEM